MEIVKTKFKFGPLSLKRLEKVHPNLVKFVTELLNISPYDIVITEGLRTLETQMEYYSYGRTKFINKWGQKTGIITKCDGIKLKSQHQVHSDGYSHAIDFAFAGSTKGRLDFSAKKYYEVRKIAEPLMQKYHIEWGGDWKTFKDMPHWQLKRV